MPANVSPDLRTRKCRGTFVQLERYQDGTTEAALLQAPSGDACFANRREHANVMDAVNRDDLRGSSNRERNLHLQENLFVHDTIALG